MVLGQGILAERDTVFAITVTVHAHEIEHILKSEEFASISATLHAITQSRLTKTAY